LSSRLQRGSLKRDLHRHLRRRHARQLHAARAVERRPHGSSHVQRQVHGVRRSTQRPGHRARVRSVGCLCSVRLQPRLGWSEHHGSLLPRWCEARLLIAIVRELGRSARTAPFFCPRNSAAAAIPAATAGTAERAAVGGAHAVAQFVHVLHREAPLRLGQALRGRNFAAMTVSRAVQRPSVPGALARSATIFEPPPRRMKMAAPELPQPGASSERRGPSRVSSGPATRRDGSAAVHPRCRCSPRAATRHNPPSSRARPARGRSR